MKFLITADIHITDRPRDDYRLGLFSWLHKQQEDHEVDATFILGDLTNDKDRHSSVLVNNMVDRLKLLNPPVFILKGNHDYISEDLPFFKFLSSINGITFCTKPTWLKDYQILLVPHQPNQAALDKAFKMVPEGCLVFMHQTITGAASETGAGLTGLSIPPEAKRATGIYSGDIHKPQELQTPNGCVTYVGAPTHIRFGDNYTPRVLLIDDERRNLERSGAR